MASGRANGLCWCGSEKNGEGGIVMVGDLLYICNGFAVYNSIMGEMVYLSGRQGVGSCLASSRSLFIYGYMCNNGGYR